MKTLRPLLLSASLLALATAFPVMAQEAPAPPLPEPETVPLILIAPAQEEVPEPGLEIVPEILPDGDGMLPPDQEEAGEPEVETGISEATMVAIPAEWSPVPRDTEGRSAYGHFLAGRYGMSTGDLTPAVNHLARAQSLTPEQTLLHERVFIAALLDGQIDRAAASVPKPNEHNEFWSQAGRLVEPIQAMAAGDARRANALMIANPVDVPHIRAGLYIQAWIAAAAGDWDRALAQPPAGLDVVSTLLLRSQRAVLLEKRRLYDEAEAEWKELTSHAVASRLFRLPYGQFLERRRRLDEAAVQYQALITAGSADGATYQGLDRVAARAKPPSLPAWTTGVAEALMIAADQATAQRAQQYAVVYLRLAEALKPDPKLAFKIGYTLRQAKQEQQARAVLSRILPDAGTVYAAARLELARSHEAEGQLEDALAELERALEVAPTDYSLAFAQAGLLLQLTRYDEALDLLNGPILNTERQGFEARYLRGAAYSALERTAEAEAELWAALQLQPDNPIVLNHLGYLWVDSGTRVQEGAEMIARAFAASPQDGNIQDSLGWAQFRQGQYSEAVLTLEQAVNKEPANAEINDHLGDAYWMVGRHREARFQWDRVLTLEAEPERLTSIRLKLALEPGDTLPAAKPSREVSADVAP